MSKDRLGCLGKPRDTRVKMRMTTARDMGNFEIVMIWVLEFGREINMDCQGTLLSFANFVPLKSFRQKKQHQIEHVTRLIKWLEK